MQHVRLAVGMSGSLAGHGKEALYGKWCGMAGAMAWYLSLAWQLAVDVKQHVHRVYVGMMAVSGVART